MQEHHIFIMKTKPSDELFGVFEGHNLIFDGSYKDVKEFVEDSLGFDIHKLIKNGERI